MSRVINVGMSKDGKHYGFKSQKSAIGGFGTITDVSYEHNAVFAFETTMSSGVNKDVVLHLVTEEPNIDTIDIDIDGKSVTLYKTTPRTAYAGTYPLVYDYIKSNDGKDVQITLMPSSAAGSGSGINYPFKRADGKPFKGKVLIEAASNSGKYTSMYSSNPKTEQIQLDVSNIINNTSVPKGHIMMFWGTTIPKNWHICDGSNKTPNLRNLFVMATTSVPSSYPKAGNHKISQLLAHRHTITFSSAGAHTHWGNPVTATSDGGGKHRHTNETEPTMRRISTCAAAWGGWKAGYKNFNGASGGSRKTSYESAHKHKAYGASWNSNAGGKHTHTIKISQTGSSISNGNNMPPYFELVYIQKIK